MDDFKTKVDRRKPQPFLDRPFLSPEECEQRLKEYVAERRARGDDRIGLIGISGTGQPHEWCSWEGMMSE